MPVEAPTMPVEARLYRWLSVVQQAHPTLPESLLEAYGAAAGEVAPETLAIACALSHDEAAGWCRYLEVHLLPPHRYDAVFAAEETVADRRMQWQRYQDDCRATSTRLAELQRQIEHEQAYKYGLVAPTEQAQVQAKIDALDQARVDLARHESDLPGAGALVHQALEEAQARLSAAQAQLRQAAVAHTQAGFTAWREALLALLQPVCQELHQARVFDEVCARLELDPHEWGRAAP